MKIACFWRLVALSVGGVSSLLSGCGSRSELDLDKAVVGAAGAAGAGGSGGTTAAGGAGAGGEGGAPICDILSETFSIQLVPPSGPSWGCALGTESAQGDLWLDASVVKSAPDVLVLDSCGPTADCIPALNNLLLEPGFALPDISVGTYVRVRLKVFYTFFGCEQTISILNLPSWLGVPNPIIQNEYLWLSASDGSTTTLEGSPFTIDTIQLDCDLGGNMGCGTPAIHELRFTPVNDPGGAITVAMGQSDTMTLPDMSVMYARNLRSYETGFCDDYWNWGYWVAGGRF